MGTVSTFKSSAEKEHEALGDMLRELNEAYARGELKTLLYAYLDSEHGVVSGVSGGMSMSEFAHKVAVLQQRLFRYIDVS